MRDAEKDIRIFLEKKIDKFREYHSITEKMKQAVCGNTENNELSELINKRQRCIGSIEKIDSIVAKIIKSDSFTIANITNKYKSLIDRTLSNIKEVMIQADIMDKQMLAIVAERRESIKTELLNMQNMRQATRGYCGIKKYPAKFLDTRR